MSMLCINVAVVADFLSYQGIAIIFHPKIYIPTQLPTYRSDNIINLSIVR